MLLEFAKAFDSVVVPFLGVLSAVLHNVASVFSHALLLRPQKSIFRVFGPENGLVLLAVGGCESL